METRPEITKKHKKMHLSRYRNRWGWLLISPAVSGLTLWVALPLLVSLVASLCDWDMVGPPQYIGLNNYKMMFTVDPSFWQAVGVTAYYTFAGVPVQIIVAFVTALLLNTNVRGIRFFRTLYYLPSILPIAVNSVLWLWLFNPHFGLLNIILEWFGFPPATVGFRFGNRHPELYFDELMERGQHRHYFFSRIAGNTQGTAGSGGD